MKKNEMIKKSEEFSSMIKTSYRLKNKYYNIYIRKGKYNYPHFGIGITKKIGNAVQRNLYKRRMRMILDNYKNDLQSNEDYLIILKENVNTLSYEEMLKSFNDLINERKLKWKNKIE